MLLKATYNILYAKCAQTILELIQPTIQHPAWTDNQLSCEFAHVENQ